MVEVQKVVFVLIDCTSLGCYELPKLNFGKCDSVSKFSPCGEDNKS